jgi:hypothetical protein
MLPRAVSAHPVNPTPTANPMQEQVTASSNEEPKNWGVEDVANWLKRTGFDQNVCDKFMSVFLLRLLQYCAD